MVQSVGYASAAFRSGAFSGYHDVSFDGRRARNIADTAARIATDSPV